MWKKLIATAFFLWTFIGVNAEPCLFKSKLNNQLLEEEFDPNTQKCCGEFGVIPRNDSSGEKLDCCGNSSYRVKDGVCCGQRLYNKTSGDMSCCGTDVYFLRNLTTLCCNDQLHTNIGPKSSCCGTSIYDKNNDFCCYDRDTKNFNLTKRDSGKLACCRWMPYNIKTHYCFRKELPLPLHFELCKNESIDVRKYICCDGKKLEKYVNGHAQKCCGSHAYGPGMKCCRTSPVYHVAPSDTYCCRDKYVTKNQRCCRNKILNAKPNEDCCGGSLYDRNTEGCCNSQAVFNKSAEKCCNGIGGVAFTTTKEKECCGSGTYDPITQVCCGNSFVINKTDPLHDSCCVPRISPRRKTAISYQKGMSLCNRNTGKIDSEPKCGREKYSTKNDLCCNHRRFENAKLLNLKCCYPGTTTFDPNAEICCDGNVYSRNIKSRCVGEIKGVDYSICRYGSWSTKDYLGALKAGKLDICRENAIRVSILSVNITMVANVAQTKFTVRPKKNLFDSSSSLSKNGEMSLYSPCAVQQSTKYTNALLITNISPFRKQLRLGDADILMPYTKKIAKAIKKRYSKCQISLIKRIKRLITIGNQQ